MRISVDIPPEWMPKLRIAAAQAGARSVAAFLRAYIQATIDTQPEQLEQDTQLTQIEQSDDESSWSIVGHPVEIDSSLPPNTIELRGKNQTVRFENVAPDAPPVNRKLTPNERIKANQAEAQRKHPLPPSLPKK